MCYRKVLLAFLCVWSGGALLWGLMNTASPTPFLLLSGMSFEMVVTLRSVVPEQVHVELLRSRCWDVSVRCILHCSLSSSPVTSSYWALGMWLMQGLFHLSFHLSSRMWPLSYWTCNSQGLWQLPFADSCPPRSWLHSFLQTHPIHFHKSFVYILSVNFWVLSQVGFSTCSRLRRQKWN